MRYGHVTKGVIDSGPRSLPKAWGNISGLNNLSESQLHDLGWLPWILVQTPIVQNQIMTGSTIQIKANEIVETQIVRDMTPQEIEDRNQQNIDSNRAIAFERLYDTDWAIVSDISNPLISNPYLLNAADFTEYRNKVQAIADNPTFNAVFPPIPNEIWSNT
jgi:hypothetical protein